MKSTRTIIAPKLREELSKDPLYKSCSLFGQEEHTCSGSITWEHALIVAGSKVQQKFAIIPLCERGHAVNNYQDAGTMRKEMNEWVALSTATDQDLLALYGEKARTAFCKARIIFQRKSYLISKYGEYRRILPVPAPILSNIPNQTPSQARYDILRQFYRGEITIDVAEQKLGNVK